MDQNSQNDVLIKNKRNNRLAYFTLKSLVLYISVSCTILYMNYDAYNISP